MLTQILIGSALIICTVIVTVIFIEVAITVFRRFSSKYFNDAGFGRFAIVLTGTTMWLLGALTVAMWMWAAAFMVLGAFDTFEEALYFSMAGFTTLGFGDVLLPHEWRLLSGFIAANGFLLFGLNTAFLIEVMLQMRGGRNEQND